MKKPLSCASRLLWLLPLLALEESAICAMGAEAVRQMVDMALRYGAILEKAMREASYGKA